MNIEITNSNSSASDIICKIIKKKGVKGKKYKKDITLFNSKDENFLK